MKISHYDVLQVSQKALPEVISAAYKNLKPVLAKAASEGDPEARNQLLFLDEAYAVLCSPEKRKIYDESISQNTSFSTYQTSNTRYEPYQNDSTFMSWWGDSKTAKLLFALVIFGVIYSAYKFTGRNTDQRIQEGKEIGTVNNDAYRAESERMLVQGVVGNQAKAIDRSYEISDREAARRRAELEYQANATNKASDLQQQRLDAQLQQQRWAQEQFEKERQMREDKAKASEAKNQLCTMYALNGKAQEARLAGCYNRY